MNQGHKLDFGAFHSDKNVDLMWEGSGEVNEPGVVPDVILCKEKQVILILQEI